MLHFSCTTINNNENVGSVTLWSPARPCCLVIMSHYFRYIVSPCSSSSHGAAWAVRSGSCALCSPRALCPDWRAHSARLMSRPSPALTTTHPTLGMSRVQGPGRGAGQTEVLKLYFYRNQNIDSITRISDLSLFCVESGKISKGRP